MSESTLRAIQLTVKNFILFRQEKEWGSVKMLLQDQTVAAITLMAHFWPGPWFDLTHKGCVFYVLGFTPIINQ